MDIDPFGIRRGAQGRSNRASGYIRLITRIKTTGIAHYRVNEKVDDLTGIEIIIAFVIGVIFVELAGFSGVIN